jgi:hypothetical protein
LADICPEDVETVTTEGLFVGKPGDFFPRFIHESDFAVIVRCEYTIGNAIEDHIKELIRFSSTHRFTAHHSIFFVQNHWGRTV